MLSIDQNDEKMLQNGKLFNCIAVKLGSIKTLE